MSLVQAYVTKQFIVVGGEGRAMNEGLIISEHIKKVLRINKTTIIGMTGDIEGNCALFSDFINRDFSLKSTDFSNLSYRDILNKIDKSYYDHNEYLQTHSVHSIVCGFDGEKLTATTYFTQDSKDELNKPTEVYPQSNNDVKVINCGDVRHYDDMLHFQWMAQSLDVSKFQNLFKVVLHEGVRYDNTINENAYFETIKLKDVII